MKYLKKELPEVFDKVNKIFGGLVESAWAIDPFFEITDETTDDELSKYILDFEERIEFVLNDSFKEEHGFFIPDDIDIVIKLVNGTEFNFTYVNEPMIDLVDNNEEYILL